MFVAADATQVNSGFPFFVIYCLSRFLFPFKCTTKPSLLFNLDERLPKVSILETRECLSVASQGRESSISVLCSAFESIVSWVRMRFTGFVCSFSFWPC